jgi:hypothetical protein
VFFLLLSLNTGIDETLSMMAAPVITPIVAEGIQGSMLGDGHIGFKRKNGKPSSLRRGECSI